MDERRLEKKFTALLVDESTTTREGNAAYKRKERALKEFKKTKPLVWRFQFLQFCALLEKVDREITLQAQGEISAFNASFNRQAIPTTPTNRT